MKKNILLLIILVLSLKLFGQKKEEFKEIYGHFVIKLHSVSTQKFADNFKAENSQAEIKWEGDVSPLTPSPPPIPEIAVFDRKNIAIHFIIMPKHYTQYTIPNDFENDSTATYGILDIIKIDKENLNTTKFVPLRYEMYESYPKTYADFNTFKLLKENREIKKRIAGYDCFQILLENIKNKMIIELYVTEEIKLNYHPNFNYKEILDKYYPLNIKVYNKDFPNDRYDEYSFYKY